MPQWIFYTRTFLHPLHFRFRPLEGKTFSFKMTSLYYQMNALFDLSVDEFDTLSSKTQLFLRSVRYFEFYCVENVALLENKDQKEAATTFDQIVSYGRITYIGLFARMGEY